jgi:hypothetical protein
MKYHLLLLVSVLLGQLLVGAIAVYYYQSKNPHINYRKAVQVYLMKSVPVYSVIIAITLIAMFLLSDYMDLNLTRADLVAKGKLTKFEIAQMNFRLIAVCFGISAELIANIVYKGVRIAIIDYGKKLGVDPINKNGTDNG